MKKLNKAQKEARRILLIRRDRQLTAKIALMAPSIITFTSASVLASSAETAGATGNIMKHIILGSDGFHPSTTSLEFDMLSVLSGDADPDRTSLAFSKLIHTNGCLPSKHYSHYTK